MGIEKGIEKMDCVTWIQKGILFFIGLCSGGVVAAGLFSFIVSIGAMNRVIGKTHTGDKVHLYENCMAAGITLANLVSLYSFSFIQWIPSWIGILFLGLFGLGAGIFIGTLIMSLAENLNALPVFARNLHMTKGIKYVILSLAAGKSAGAWLDFWMEMK